MAAKEPTKIDFEFTIESLDFPGRRRFLHTDHALTAKLIWPRSSIAQKSSQHAITLRKGAWDGTGLPWNQRILFKEPCEGNFALQIALSVSVTRVWLASFRRTMCGYALKSAGEYIDNYGPAGEMAEAPLKALSKDLLANRDPEILASGCVDLTAAKCAAEAPCTIAVPLYAELTLSRLKKHLTATQRIIGTAVIKIQ